MNINSILAYYQNINLKHEWEFQFCLGYKQLQRMMLSPKQWKNNELAKKKKEEEKKDHNYFWAASELRLQGSSKKWNS